MHRRWNGLWNILLWGLVCVFVSSGAVCQNVEAGPAKSSFSQITEARFSEDSFPTGTFGEDAGDATAGQGSDHHGLVSRMVRRGLEDQRELYEAPFKRSNIKWDAVVLAGTAGFLIADRRIENALPYGHYTLFTDGSDVLIGGMGAAMAGLWAYGMKGNHPHAKEVGDLELETLVNTFLIYVPMQYIAGRQRPGEGTGRGDFLKHHALNTSFPSGHAMFGWAMATVAAHEYHKPWQQALFYGVALAITGGRMLGHDHWPSDMFVGSALGIGIGTHIFHAHCDPALNESCGHHHNKVEYRADQRGPW
ncbi:MAG TPA: phosphatase PAP2 family protein [Candidatus Sulfotelmatobacter sp.]|nr:phosphatase PAP2 family protein [Candidatus Sulfotelmatobacter sp.]